MIVIFVAQAKIHIFESHFSLQFTGGLIIKLIAFISISLLLLTVLASGQNNSSLQFGNYSVVSLNNSTNLSANYSLESFKNSSIASLGSNLSGSSGNKSMVFENDSTELSNDESPASIEDESLESIENDSTKSLEDDSYSSFPEIWMDSMNSGSPASMADYYYDSDLYSQIPAANSPISLAFPVSNMSREGGSDLLVINITSDPATNAFSSQISAFSGSNGSELWQKEYPDSLVFAAPAGDLNGDRRTDIMVDTVIAGTSFIPYSGITALDGTNGIEIWSNPHFLAATIAYPVKDITGDNAAEFLVHVFGIDSLNGTVATKIAEVDGSSGAEIGSKIFSGAVAVEYPAGNYTGDLVQDSLTAIYKINQTEQNVTTEIQAVDGQGRAVLWNKSFPSLAIAQPIKDLTGDGRDEIVVYLMSFAANATNSSEMAVLQGSDGVLLWKNSLGNALAFVVAGPDLTGDGKADLIAYKLGGEGESEVVAIKGDDGTTLWSRMGTVILPQ